MADEAPKMTPSTKPRLDVSKEPQTISMQHQEKGDAKDPTAKQGKDQSSTGEAEAGNKTSLTWNE